MNKKIFLTILATFMLLLTACSSDSKKESGNTNSGEDEKKSITFATTSDVISLSPLLMNDSISANATEHIYEQLFMLDEETLEIEPLLAESYENPDELTWTIKLKEDIQFQDGTPFNAEAVKYTFEKLRDPATAAPRASLMEPVDTITVIDENTVEIKTLYPFGPFLATLSHTNTAIVSPTADQNQELMNDPVGTGPYKFVSWTPGDQVVMEANKDYWGEIPEMDEFIIKVVPEISTAISMLQTGEVQFIDNLPTEQINRIESMEDINIIKEDATTVYYFTPNHSKERSQDAEFREALFSAIDRDAFVSKLNGLGVRSDSILGPKVFGFDEALDEAGTAYDLERAKELVKENGYDKEPIKLLTANRDNFILMAEIVQSQLTEAGFDVQIESMEWATFLDTARAGDYDLTFLSWSNITADGSEMFYPNFHGDNVGSSNRAQYSNKEFDKLVDASRSSIEEDERRKYLEEANEFMLEDDAALIMYHGVVTAALNDEYSGLVLLPNGKWHVNNVTKE